VKSTNQRSRPIPPLGTRIERAIERVEMRAAVSVARSTALGAGLGVVTIAGGLGAFLLAWYVLVEFLA
jgi:hypothetical protein